MRTSGKRERAEKQEEVAEPAGNIASAGDLKAGDRVVYPKQGVYRVTGLEQQDIAGQRLEFVKMTREEDGASVLVPLAKVPTIGLRRVASADDIEGVFHYLGASYDDPELDWKVRHRDNVERLIAGGVLGVAEVVKGLHSLARMRPLPAKERELYDSSRHLLVNEISVSLGVPEVIAEDYVDFALMPPAGVKLPLKPPPTPVELKGPPWKRKKAVAADDDDDLGLAELGIDLGALEGVAEGANGAGEESEEGESETAAPAEEGAEERSEEAEKVAPAKPPAKAPPKTAPAATKKAPAKAAPAPAAKAAAAKTAAKPPAPKPAVAKVAPKKAAARPAAKPAAKPTAKAPAKVAPPRKAAPARKPAARAAPPKKGAKPAKGKKK